MPRTQPCRKRLAIHARQLALKSRLQILRRSRRALLRGLEQARRSALAHHVHRIASMGARVLINGTWYYRVFLVSAAIAGGAQCGMNGIDNRTGVAVAIALGVVIPITVAVILLWSGAIAVRSSAVPRQLSEKKLSLVTSKSRG